MNENKQNENLRREYYKEGKDMSKLSTYIKGDKDFLYSFASKNTPRNQNGVVVTKDDEWLNEPEWDEIFKEMEGN